MEHVAVVGSSWTEDSALWVGGEDGEVSQAKLVTL